MLIAVLSDIHDNLENLKKCLGWCCTNEIKQIIFCGDTTTSETIKNLAAFSGEIFMVRGNIELFSKTELGAYRNIRYYGETGLLELAGLHIGLVHEPAKIKILLESTAKTIDYIFYGHTHKPWLERRGSTIIANPGNLAGVWHQATFATLDTGSRRIELKLLAEL